MMTEIAVETLIDADRYPIHRLASPEGQALIAASRRQFEAEGALVLDGFLKPAAIERMLAETRPLHASIYYCAHRHNVYLAAEDPALAPDHPRNRTVVSDKGCIPDDRIPPDSALRALYTWEPLRAFLAALLGYERLHPYEDPLGSLNVNLADAGQQLGWHFDNAAFATTLLLQTPDEGGAFEYVPGIRSAEDPGYDPVGRALDGARDAVRILAQGPGALVLFRGRHALHRVAPSWGRPRIIAILSYDQEPGRQLTEFTRQLFYGRTA
jgi:hypothetical protein